MGECAIIGPPFHRDCSFNIRLGAGVFLNFNCIILDVVAIIIGDRAQVGADVWTGNGAIIGAGSLVTRDVAADTTFMCNQAKPQL